MNKYGSIITYRRKIDHNIFLKAINKFRVNRDLNRVIASIDPIKLKEIQTEFKDFAPYPGYSKYLDIKPWMLDNVWRAYILGLNSTTPKNILDIGTGNGYFPYLCKRYGHQVRTIDIESDPIFNALIDLLEIPRREYAVKAYEPIPPFDIKFDLVTGFHTYFNGHRTENVWTSKEWNFFLKDLKENLCNPGAEAYFIINKEHDVEDYFTKELESYFLSCGAEIDENRVYFKNLDKIK